MDAIPINDGGGLFDQFGLIDQMILEVEAIADARGTARCILLANLAGQLKALKEGLQKEQTRKGFATRNAAINTCCEARPAAGEDVRRDEKEQNRKGFATRNAASSGFGEARPAAGEDVRRDEKERENHGH